MAKDNKIIIWIIIIIVLLLILTGKIDLSQIFQIGTTIPTPTGSEGFGAGIA